MRTKLIRTRIVHLTTQIATVFRITKNSGGFYVVIGLFTPFLHLFAKPGQEGVLHWKWMASFLDSLGWALLPLFIGMGLLVYSKRLQKHEGIILKIMSFGLIAIGSFYVAYTLISIRDFTNPQYYGMLSIIGITSTVFLYYLVGMVQTIEQKLKTMIDKLITFIAFSDRYMESMEKKHEHITDYNVIFDELTE